ncbi:MAG: 1-acyl-sn-glycerol-3-phosphate acyltransferase [Nanoarchaeota archaeon]|nr:1-acyl-sn-glycerol-3-phosphate acyltransferase [Nanoarchaeota archaeon]MBU1005519.1 1-acyl-sn-glycerol-3-phosphate acyltransferase [Nanoarchaeota archaeon]MBU1945858.1 1-acyl-sn-glycerol-3-phosphate acyltransferase [Nanoarchaeota archaeon]
MGNLVYSLGKLVVRSIYLSKVKIIVKGKLPKKSAIIVANHDNPWDPPLIMIADGRIVHFFTAHILFKNILSRVFLREIGQIPVQSGLKDVNNKAFSEAKRYLSKGELVGIFPYPDDLIKKKKVLYTGVIRLIIENDVQIVPVKVKLDEKRKWKSFFDVNFDKAEVIIGKPLVGFRERCVNNKGKNHCLCMTKELVEYIEKLK